MLLCGRSTSRPLPSEWLPSAATCVGIFLLACSHALFYLMCRWSVDFRLRWLYAPAKSVRAGCQVRPANPGGIAPPRPLVFASQNVSPSDPVRCSPGLLQAAAAQRQAHARATATGKD